MKVSRIFGCSVLSISTGFDCVVDVSEVASFSHGSEGEAVTMLTYEKMPYFNAVFLQNKTQVVKVEEMVP